MEIFYLDINNKLIIPVSCSYTTMIFFGHLGLTLLFVFVVFYLLREKVDYRFVLVGAILPDLIDKPIGHYIFYSVFQNGRIFAHTLLFIAVLTLIGYYVAKKYKFIGVEFLALGAMMHLAEDQMWLSPETLFWPLFGWQFPKLDIENYAGYIWHVLFTDPSAYVPEIAGLAVLIGFTYYFKMYQPERLKSFIMNGQLSTQQNIA